MQHVGGQLLEGDQALLVVRGECACRASVKLEMARPSMVAMRKDDDRKRAKLAIREQTSYLHMYLLVFETVELTETV